MNMLCHGGNYTIKIMYNPKKSFVKVRDEFFYTLRGDNNENQSRHCNRRGEAAFGGDD